LLKQERARYLSKSKGNYLENELTNISSGELIMVQAYVLFKVSSGTEKEACKKIADFDEVLVAGVVYGEYDVIAKISVPNMMGLEEFVTEKIRKVPSVILTSTMIISREYKGKNQRRAK